MRESDTFQAILDEGRVEGAQRMLLHRGRKKFGEPNEATRNALRAIQDLDRLEHLIDRLLDVATTWQELLQNP